MHEFIITKEDEDIDKTIIGLKGRSSEGTNWVMRKTCIRAKPNSQIADWSPKLWLLHGVPETDSLPNGTARFHLFRKLTRDSKKITQSPAELEKKLKELKSTVNDVSKMNQFDSEDKKWWGDFFSVRSRTRSRLGEDGEDCESDELSLPMVKDLLWSVRTPVVVEDTTPEIDDGTDTGVRACPLRDLATVLLPRTIPAGVDEFGRSRKTGYVRVGADETPEEVLRALKQKGRVCSENTRLEFFKSLQLSRGEGAEGELNLAKNHFEVSAFRVCGDILRICFLNRSNRLNKRRF